MRLLFFEPCEDSLSKLISNDFRPTVAHEFYIIRTILYRIVCEFSSSRYSGNILDFGCGNGPYRCLFDDSNYVAVDFPSTGHSETDKKVDVYWDGKKLPFSDGSFDTVLMTEVLEHLFEPDIVMSELYRVLRPGGRLLLTTPFIWELHETPYDFARYTPFGIRDLAARSGFTVLECKKHGSNFDALIQVAICSRFLAGKRFTHRINQILTLWLNSMSHVSRMQSTVNSTTNECGYYVTNEFVLTKL